MPRVNTIIAFLSIAFDLLITGNRAFDEMLFESSRFPRHACKCNLFSLNNFRATEQTNKKQNKAKQNKREIKKGKHHIQNCVCIATIDNNHDYTTFVVV